MALLFLISYLLFPLTCYNHLMNITAGIYKGRKVKAPDENIVRPTLSKIRESIFNVLFSMMDFEGKFFLDMFAGSGIMGLEALSRGFLRTVAIEKNPRVARTLKDNYTNLDITPDILIGDSLKLLPRIPRKFDVIYLDPPYFSEIYEDSLKVIKESDVLNKDGIVILEHVTEVDWENLGFNLIKQKKYSQKFITFLSV